MSGETIKPGFYVGIKCEDIAAYPEHVRAGYILSRCLPVVKQFLTWLKDGDIELKGDFEISGLLDSGQPDPPKLRLVPPDPPNVA